jgi:hypothetical protein
LCVVVAVVVVVVPAHQILLVVLQALSIRQVVPITLLTQVPVGQVLQVPLVEGVLKATGLHHPAGGVIPEQVVAVGVLAVALVTTLQRHLITVLKLQVVVEEAMPSLETETLLGPQPARELEAFHEHRFFLQHYFGGRRSALHGSRL